MTGDKLLTGGYVPADLVAGGVSCPATAMSDSLNLLRKQQQEALSGGLGRCEDDSRVDGRRLTLARRGLALAA